MTVKAHMPVRTLNLVVPLAHEATAMRITETAAPPLARPGAATSLIGASLRPGSVDSTNKRSTPSRTPGTRTSTTATRTTTTRSTRLAPEPSADSDLFERLVQAYLDCRRNKRNSTSAQAFEAHLERNLCDLHDDLTSGSYRIGRSICFVVTRPKPREVWAADFRDRIVHHLLYNHIAPRFHARFTADSCACIPGRGTLYAARRLEHQVRSVTQNWSKPAHYLKCDWANFFVSINNSVLLDQLGRHITEPWWMSLATTVLMHDPRLDVEVRGSTHLLNLVPPHKSLFNAPAGHGLPIGNLSSQFFANVLLNDLDQRVKQVLKAKHYLRYVDDFVLMHPSPIWLNDVLVDLSTWLPTTLHLRLNDRKTILQPVYRGVDFVGHVIKPWHRSTRRGTVNKAIVRVITEPAKSVQQLANSYFGLLTQASHSHRDRARLANAVRERGHCVTGDLKRACA
jgi:RNA-directed DNA polymerase